MNVFHLDGINYHAMQDEIDDDDDDGNGDVDGYDTKCYSKLELKQIDNSIKMEDNHNNNTKGPKKICVLVRYKIAFTRRN